MDTAKIYHDSEGNERTIHQMIKDEPHWAANRLQEGETAISKLDSLSDYIKDIQWSGECSCCNPSSWVGEHPCTQCDQGKITRPATIEEVLVAAPEMLSALICSRGTTHRFRSWVINNGTLSIKEV